jgi:hypothetical protein
LHVGCGKRAGEKELVYKVSKTRIAHHGV